MKKTSVTFRAASRKQMFEFEVVAQEGIQAWYCKPCQKSMTLKITGSEQEPPTVASLDNLCQTAS